MIRFANDGPLLIASNFWETDAAKAGRFFISTNERCFRVLVPDSLVDAGHIEEMKTGASCEVERRTRQGKEMLRIWFLDGSDSPYRVESSAEMLDRLPIDDDAGRDDLSVAVYVDGPRKVLELSAKYLGRIG